jgi:hypothetical protein
MKYVWLLSCIFVSAGCAGSNQSEPDSGIPDGEVLQENFEFDTSDHQDRNQQNELDISDHQSYAALFVNSSISLVPIIGEVRNLNVALLRFDVQPDQDNDDEFLLERTVCSLEQISDTKLVGIVMPDAFVNSMPQMTRRLVFQKRSNDSSYDVFLIRSTEVLGVILDDPENDPLPTTADDPAVFDQDNDGQPGLTVRVQGLINGEIYIIQRGWDRGTGTYLPNDSGKIISGLLEWDLEQVILGADNPLLETPNQSWVDPDPNNSWFEMAAIDPNTDCDTLIDQKESIFERWPDVYSSNNYYRCKKHF